MPISRELVLLIIRYLIDNPEFYFPFSIHNQSYSEDDELYEVEFCIESYKEIHEKEEYNKFTLSENLQNLNLDTIELMSKGFIEKIINDDVIVKITQLALEYRKEWKEDLWESEKIEEYGLNEFIGGKAEAYEECLEILHKTHNI
jgi:hypothetical protein